MKKCRYADKYKAIYQPKCNKGEPCEVCTAKWAAAEEKRRHLAGLTSYMLGGAGK